MAETSIPDDIRNFILDFVDSIAYIEALMLLTRDSNVSWDSATLASRLYISVEEANRVLDRIRYHGLLIEENGFYRYECNSAELQSIVSRLAQIYATQLIPVTHLIHSKTSMRVQQFADAFKLRMGK